jgi:hypothetical protein
MYLADLGGAGKRLSNNRCFTRFFTHKKLPWTSLNITGHSTLRIPKIFGCCVSGWSEQNTGLIIELKNYMNKKLI